MKNFTKLTMLLLSVIMLSACSKGYYSHMPRTKTKNPHETVKNEKKQEPVSVQDDVENTEAELAIGEALEEKIIANASTMVTAEKSEVKVKEDANKVEKTIPAIVPKRVMKKITKKLEPTQAEETNHSTVSVGGLIIVGVILMLVFPGTVFASIGYIFVVIAIILLLLSLIGVHHHH